MKSRDIYMAGGSAWFQRIASELEQHKYALNAKEIKKYKLDLLLRVARRVDEFSQTCSECQANKDEITRLVQELNLIFQLPGQASKEAQKKHTGAVKKLVEHLKKTHKLVDKNHYIGLGISIGTAIGAGSSGALSELLDFAGLGTIVGIALGLAIGYYLDKKAEKENRVI